MFKALLHRKFRRRYQLELEAGRFAATHVAGAAAGLIAAALWLWLAMPANGLERAAFLLLLAPLGLAGALRYVPSLAALEAASALAAILTLTLLAALTGGLTSLFLPWLILVPAEAALTKRKAALMAAMAAGAAALLALYFAGMKGALPPSAIPADWSASLTALSLIGAFFYAGILALAVERRANEAAMRIAASEAHYRFLADNAADLILRLSPQGEVLYASPAAKGLILRRPSEIEGRNLADLLSMEDRQEVLHALIRAAYFGEERRVTGRLLARSGEAVWVEIHAAPIAKDRAAETGGILRRLFLRSEKLAPSGTEIIAIARDIRTQKAEEGRLAALKDAAESRNAAKSRFLANMSHELRTPLNSILGFSEMIEKEMFGPSGHPRYKEYAGLIGEGGRFLLDLINDVLDMSKIEAGKFTLSKEPVALEEMLARIERIMAPQFRDKSVALKIEIDDGLMPISADARGLRQILFNLLSNALKFTPKGGAVRVTVRRLGGALRLTVRDSGIGMSSADLERVSQPFERAESSYVRAQEGTGLGLSLVKNLVHLHHGSLRIESKLGTGTQVVIDLPGADKAHAPPRAA